MSYSAKRRLVLGFLLFAAAWPLAHRVLVTTSGIDPWRLGGWAMYCTPKLRVEVALVPERAGRPVDLELPPGLSQTASRLAQRRAVLGRLASPEGLAREALEQLDADSVVVTLQRDRLDTETNRIIGDREYFRYSFDETGGIVGKRFGVRTVP